jgi:hypothetical protein
MLAWKSLAGTQAVKMIERQLQAISKKGFWFKIAAEVKFKPEAYSSILRI